MRRDWPKLSRVAPFLLALPLLVHCFDTIVPAFSQAKPKAGPAEKAPHPPPKIHYGIDQLPDAVRDMREAILAAAQSGDVEELRQVYEMNDIRPDLGAAAGDPIAYWKRASADGRGLEMLATLSLILEAGYVVLPLGRDLENNRLYIWPYFAEIPLDKLTAAQEVELLRLVPFAAAKAMMARGKYIHWRVTIGADGAWHSFRKDE
jgi:hypothetical protein